MSTDNARNFKQFNLEITQANTGLSEEELVKVHKTLSIEGFSRIVQRTPVDTGRTRGNWQLQVNQPSAATKAGKPDKGGAATIGRETKKVASLPAFAIVTITNNVPWIFTLEEGGFIPKNPGPSKDKRKGRNGRILVKDGYSVQAPRGMVKITFEELKSIF